MIGTEHDIVDHIDAAKTSAAAADAFIQQYMGFIRSETVKFIHTAPENGHEDELSIAMLAFYESILSYEKGKGAFLPYAARAIKNRLIDHYRIERRHGNLISLHTPTGEDGDGQLLDDLPEQQGEMEALELRMSSQGEIAAFCAQLSGLGISLSDVADNCPRQARTVAACKRVLEYAKVQPQLLERVVESGRLPMKELAQGAGTDQKTMERHRKYLVSILLAFTNGYEIIRGHLGQIGFVKGGGAI